MKYKYFFAPILIFVFAAFAGTVLAQVDTRAVPTWEVEKYELSVTLPTVETDRAFSARALLSLKNISGKNASSLTLRISPSADVSAININGSAADFSKSEEKSGSGGSLQRIAIRIPGLASGSELNASVDYKLTVKENSGLGSITPVGSQFLPMSFWYPTPTSWFYARGADFAPFILKVTGPSGSTFVSSGVASGGKFEQKYVGQPFFTSGSWDMDNFKGVEVYMPKGGAAETKRLAADLADIYLQARDFASAKLGSPPDSPLRIVAVRRGGGFAGGGTVFVDEAVFRRPKIDSQTAMAMAEAAVKVWIANLISVTGDSPGTISEGLPRYLATEFIENKFGKDVADVERSRQRTAYAAVSKRDIPLSQVSPIDDFYYGEVANKGSMIWRLIAKRVGPDQFINTLRSGLKDGTFSVAELRQLFSQEKDLLDYLFDKTTDMNLLAGIPQVSGAETRVALRNTGPIEATVTVSATLAGGQVMDTQATIRALSFGDVAFKTGNKVTKVEVDREKLYPQTDYSDDVAPRETTETDLLLGVKRNFDKQDFAAAESSARAVLGSLPRFDDVRVLLGRSLLALGRLPDAEREFQAVLAEKLPSSRSIAWAQVGLGEIAAKANRNNDALKYASAAIQTDAEYGASLAARNLRNKLNIAPAGDQRAKQFIADFGRAVLSNRKADVMALVMPGEAVKFANGLSGSTEQWQASIRQIDVLDSNDILVETDVNLKLLTRDPASGIAVFRLAKVGDVWKLNAVDMFEVK
jgi:hypothetical protein